MKIGIIGPCEPEIMPFIQGISGAKVQRHAMLDFHIGKYAGIDVIALFCGVCKVNAAIAAQVLIDRYGVTHMIVTGVAGAIDEKLKILDTVIATEVAYHDVADGILTGYHPWMETVYFHTDEALRERMHAVCAGDPTVVFGKMVTGEAFIEQDGRKEIMERHDPLCVDMETASIAHVCYVNEIPFIAIRSISDTPHESGSESFEKHVDWASLKSIEVLKKYLDFLGRSPS